jgi:hypothetical protein
VPRINPETLNRLRRAFDDGDAPPAHLAQFIVQAYAERLTPHGALLLERWMTCVASAVEELGQGAGHAAILARADEIEARLS